MTMILCFEYQSVFAYLAGLKHLLHSVQIMNICENILHLHGIIGNMLSMNFEIVNLNIKIS